MQNTTRNSRRLNISIIHIAALGVVIGLALTGCGGSDLTGGAMLSKPPRPTTPTPNQATANGASATQMALTQEEDPMDVMPLFQNGIYVGTMSINGMTKDVQVTVDLDWDGEGLAGTMGLVRGTEKAGYPIRASADGGNAHIISSESGSGSEKLLSDFGSSVTIDCFPSRSGEDIVAIAYVSAKSASPIQFQLRPVE